MTTPLLEVEDLTIKFQTPLGVAEVVNGVNLTLNEGDVHGVVGESGSGKSVSARAILGLLPKRNIVELSGAVKYKGRNLLELSEKEMRAEIRGHEIGMVFQDPMTALAPTMRVGRQIMLPLRKRMGMSKSEAQSRAIELLDQVGIPDPERRALSYPHEMSGGQRQRVMIAFSLACEPTLLIADEPTTALDVTIQAQILDLFGKLRAERGLSLLMVSHDLTLIAERCDEVSVMYAGRVIENGTAKRVLGRPEHPYTSALEAARPRPEDPPHTILRTIAGTVPDLRHLPAGCSFAARCSLAQDDCLTSVPLLDPSTGAACFHPLSSAQTTASAGGLS